MERYIFDIDGTLLYAKWEDEDKFFYQKLGSETEKFIKQKISLLTEYEDTFKKYDVNMLSKHLSKSGVHISEDLINEWIHFNGDNIPDKINTHAIDVLEHLKEEDKKMSILTNWFSVTQIKRLERAGILKYFDTIICGDTVLKPNEESYSLASSDTKIDRCIMIGDNLEKDYLGPQNIGMKSIFVKEENDLVKVKTLGGIKYGRD